MASDIAKIICNYVERNTPIFTVTTYLNWDGKISHFDTICFSNYDEAYQYMILYAAQITKLRSNVNIENPRNLNILDLDSTSKSSINILIQKLKELLILHHSAEITDNNISFEEVSDRTSKRGCLFVPKYYQIIIRNSSQVIANLSNDYVNKANV